MITILVATSIRLYREGLSDTLARYDGLSVIGTAASGAEAIERVGAMQPDVLLLDMQLSDGLRTMTAVSELGANTRVLALAIPEREREIVACAEAGAAGFVPREASLADLVQALRSVVRGELRCSPAVAQCLLRRVRALASTSGQDDHEPLTPRQRQIAELVRRGLSNKEIAVQLHIELSTVKNHVHSILEKMRVQRRGQLAAKLRLATL